MESKPYRVRPGFEHQGGSAKGLGIDTSALRQLSRASRSLARPYKVELQGCALKA